MERQPGHIPPAQPAVSIFWKVFIVIFLFVYASIVLVTFLLPEEYASTTRINPLGDTIDGTSTVSYGTWFPQTTMEIMQSQAVLTNVVSELDLNVKWGKKYFGGETLSYAESMNLIRRHLKIRSIANARLIEITAYSEDRIEAAQLANAIADSYRKYRLDAFENMSQNQLSILAVKINEATSYLLVLSNQLKVADNSSVLTHSLKESQKAGLPQSYLDAKRNLENLQELQNDLAADPERQNLDLNMYSPAFVKIVDLAVPGDRPVKPNRPLNLILGIIPAAMLGAVAGFAAIFMTRKLEKRGFRFVKPA